MNPSCEYHLRIFRCGKPLSISPSCKNISDKTLMRPSYHFLTTLGTVRMSPILSVCSILTLCVRANFTVPPANIQIGREVTYLEILLTSWCEFSAECIRNLKPPANADDAKRFASRSLISSATSVFASHLRSVLWPIENLMISPNVWKNFKIFSSFYWKHLLLFQQMPTCISTQTSLLYLFFEFFEMIESSTDCSISRTREVLRTLLQQEGNPLDISSRRTKPPSSLFSIYWENVQDVMVNGAEWFRVLVNVAYSWLTSTSQSVQLTIANRLFFLMFA